MNWPRSLRLTISVIFMGAWLVLLAQASWWALVPFTLALLVVFPRRPKKGARDDQQS